MAQTFILSCESTVDLPYSYIEGRGIPVLFYHYTANGQDYVDDMGRDPEGLTKFYARIAQGALPSTSQLNTYDYMSFLESLLAQGDVLHIAFGSGMTKSVERAQEAAPGAAREVSEPPSRRHRLHLLLLRLRHAGGRRRRPARPRRKHGDGRSVGARPLAPDSHPVLLHRSFLLPPRPGAFQAPAATTARF